MKLIICEPTGEKREVELKSETYSLGRTEDNQIVIDDNKVSGKHAKLTRENDTFFIVDLKSRYGVFVNKERIREKEQLKDGDLIQVGNSKIEVKKVKKAKKADKADKADKSEMPQYETMVMEAPHMIVLSNTKKVYKLGKTEVNALKGVDLKVQEGELFLSAALREVVNRHC